MGKLEGKKPLGRPRCRWDDNIKMDLQEMRFGGMDWIDLAQDRDRWRALVNAVMNYKSYCSTVQFCRSISIYQPTNAHIISHKTL